MLQVADDMNQTGKIFNLKKRASAIDGVGQTGMRLKETLEPNNGVTVFEPEDAVESLEPVKRRSSL